MCEGLHAATRRWPSPAGRYRPRAGAARTAPSAALAELRGMVAMCDGVIDVKCILLYSEFARFPQGFIVYLLHP